MRIVIASSVAMLVACASAPPPSEPSTSKTTSRLSKIGCKEIDPQPDLDLEELTKESLSATVPFTFGHAKANVHAAYARFFEGFERQPSAPPEVRKKTEHGYSVERLGGGITETECRKQRESFRFESVGVWYFFDHQDRVKTIRIDPPFAGTYRGVKLGITRDELVAQLGEPFRIFEWNKDHAHVFKMPNGNNLRVDIDPETQTAVRMFD